MAFDVRIDAARGAATLAGAPLVFHCHYYNCALQQSIELGLGDAAPALLRDAAEHAALEQLRALAQDDRAATLRTAAELYAELGFGVLDFDDVIAGGHTVRIRGSHYALGWLAVYGERPTGACHFAAGFVAAALRIAEGRDEVTVREVRCVACGDAVCELEVSP